MTRCTEERSRRQLLKGLQISQPWGEPLVTPEGRTIDVRVFVKPLAEKPRSIAAGPVLAFVWRCECRLQRVEEFMLLEEVRLRRLTVTELQELRGKARRTNLELLYGRRRRQREIRKAEAAGPLEVQQRHSPVSPVMVEISRTKVSDGVGGLRDVRRTMQQGWMRELDRRLVESLTEPQLHALHEIGDLLAAVCRGQSSTLADLYHVDGGRPGGPEGKLDAIERVAEWERACKAEGLRVEVVRHVLNDGMSFGAVNRQYGKRYKQWASEQFRACLDVKAKQRGWLGRGGEVNVEALRR